MQGKRLFLQWSLFACAVAVGFVILSRLGWSHYVLRGDPTHITLVTFGVFLLTTLWCGRLAWRASNGRDQETLRHELESGWFASSVCVTLGLLGTVVGYFLMMQDVSNGGADAAEQLVRQIRTGMGTVLINTIVGGACGLLIELQSHFLGQALRPQPAKPASDVRNAARKP